MSNPDNLGVSVLRPDHAVARCSTIPGHYVAADDSGLRVDRPTPGIFSHSAMNSSIKLLARLQILLGNALTVVGCVSLLLAAIGLIPVQFFAIGISSGIRVIGSIAIAGCLLSAMGYGISDHFDK
jgi:hypothetical protein